MGTMKQISKVQLSVKLSRYSQDIANCQDDKSNS